jgi:CRP-like cAMP-binding protein
MDFENRNEDRLRIAITAINQIVPEFEEFPQNMQKSFVQYGFYEEFEPGRIILKEGHPASNYYFIISGAAMVTIVSNDEITGEVKNRPISFLKRGNTFGDSALINNSRRSSTVISHGDHVVGLISIYKEDFFRFSSPALSFQDRKIFLNSQVPILNMINYPVECLNTLSDKLCKTVYYKKG